LVQANVLSTYRDKRNRNNGRCADLCSGENSSPSTLLDSIACVDSDADSVPDDVDSYIDTTYAGVTNADLNKALHQHAKAAQSSLLDADNQPPSLTHATERFRAVECLMARRPGDFRMIFIDLRAQILKGRSPRDTGRHCPSPVGTDH
jgi:hypothetical protein